MRYAVKDIGFEPGGAFVDIIDEKVRGSLMVNPEKLTHECPDSWEFEDEYDDGYECSNCGKPFILERIVDITYTSKRRIEDMPEGWVVE